jgi:hypothetical protein
MEVQRGNRGRLHLKCDGTRAETRFRLSAKWTSPFKSAGASVQSTIGSRGVRISGSNAGYAMFRGSVKSTGYPLHSPVSPSLPRPFVNVCHHISTGLYSSTVSLISPLDRPFYLRELPATQWAARTVWTGEGNLSTTGIRSPVGESLYQLRYPRLTNAFTATTN